MISHDNIDALFGQALDLGPGGCATIDRDQKRRPGPGIQAAIDGRVTQSVTLPAADGDKGLRVQAIGRKKVAQDDNRGDSIHIVVPEDTSPLTLIDGLQDALDRDVHLGQLEGIA